MIPDKDKTKEQLVDEMALLCQRIAELEILETKRKWAEQRLEHLNAVLRTIRKVNQLIFREKDPDRLLESICDSFIITRGYYKHLDCSAR